MNASAPPGLPVLIIGYGNPLRSDDGVGYYAACMLAESDWMGAAVEVVACHQLTPELSLALSRAGRIIFIDARATGETSSADCIFHETVQPDLSASPSLTHHVTPATLLTWAELLYGAHPTGEIFSVEGATFDYGTELSPQVRAALPKLLAAVRAAVETTPLRQCAGRSHP